MPRRQWQSNRINKGVTIIEALVVLFIFALITVTFYSTFTLGMNYIAESKNRLGAVALANEKMEIIRNLKYEDVGVQGGIPGGNIPEDEDVVENGKSYHIKTFAQYIDDPFDGTLSTTDTVPNDYKRVKVAVSWNGPRGGGEVISVSRFVPAGMEMAAGDGILSINVLDAQAQPVAQSNVSIINNDISPSVNINSKTDNSGNLMFPGAEESIQKYQITIAKNGYETISTVDPTTITEYNPIDTHASVVAGAVNTKTITQNKLSDLEISSVDADDAPLANVGFDIQGGRNLGNKFSDGKPYYNLQETNQQTDGTGKENYDSISPGQYEFFNLGAVSGYTLVGVSDITSFESGSLAKYVYSLAADDDKTIKIKYADNNIDALLVRVVRDDDDSPIGGASVKLAGGGGGSVTETTLADGVAFFKSAAGTYTLEITITGFQNYSDSAEIDKLTNKEARLTVD